MNFNFFKLRPRHIIPSRPAFLYHEISDIASTLPVTRRKRKVTAAALPRREVTAADLPGIEEPSVEFPPIIVPEEEEEDEGEHGDYDGGPDFVFVPLRLRHVAHTTFARGVASVDLFVIENMPIELDFAGQLTALRDLIWNEYNRISSAFSSRNYRYQLRFKVRLTKVSDLSSTSIRVPFHTISQVESQGLPILLRKRNFYHHYSRGINSFQAQFDAMQSQTYDMIFDRITQVEIKIGSARIPAVGMYMPTPDFIANKKATINLQVFDSKCFYWACICSLNFHHLKDHRSDLSSYRRFVPSCPLDFSHCVFPFIPSYENCEIFEKDNPCYSLFIYGFTKDFDEFCYYYISPQENGKIPILLMVLSCKDPTNDDNFLFHFITITNFNVFCRIESNIGHSRSHVFCFYCLRAFSSEIFLHEHICAARDRKIIQEFRLPSKEDSLLHYKTIKKYQPHTLVSYEKLIPFAIFMDFEARIDPITNEHIPISCGMLLTWFDDAVPHKFDFAECFKIFSDENPLALFQKIWKQLTIWSDNILEPYNNFFVSSKKYTFYSKTLLSAKQQENANKLDITGSYSHEPDIKNTVPVFFHNFGRYDSQFFIQYSFQLGYKPKLNSIIGSNLQSLMTITFDRFVFLDSYLFLPFSLANLIIFNKHGDSASTPHFPLLHKWIENFYKENQISAISLDATKELLTQKGVFPYSFLDSYEKFQYSSFPSIDKFQADVIGKNITQTEWESAQTIWQTLKCKTLQNYHDIYLARDVLGLADVFQQFRLNFFDSYKLDPAHYLSIPMFSWDAMLKYLHDTRINFNISCFYDGQMDIYEFFEKGRRGGLSFVNLRYADTTAGDQIIKYFDANALYSSCCLFPLPIDNFAFVLVDDSVHTLAWLKSLNPFDSTGYYFEVDLTYPPELHTQPAHKNYPLCCENLLITNDMLSPLQNEQHLKQFGSYNLENTPKLVATFLPKKKYVISLLHLQQVLSLGLHLDKIHRIVKFRQEPFLKDFINFNIDKRIHSPNDFGKVIYKLINNSIYGKSTENMKLRTKFNLFTTEAGFRTFIEHPNLQDLPNFDNFFSWGVLIPSVKHTVTLNKPIAIGVTILEMAKYIMNRFHYEFFMPKFPSAKLLFTDTDSLCYVIEKMTLENFNNILFDDRENRQKYFDFSNYPSDHLLFSDSRKGALLHFKDECPPPNSISAFVGLKPKCYSFSYQNEKELCKAKGIAQNSLAKNDEENENSFQKTKLLFKNYKETLFEQKPLIIKQATIEPNKEQQIHTIITQKICLSSFENKFFRCYSTDPQGINGIPFGSIEIQKLN